MASVSKRQLATYAYPITVSVAIQKLSLRLGKTQALAASFSVYIYLGRNVLDLQTTAEDLLPEQAETSRIAISRPALRSRDIRVLPNLHRKRGKTQRRAEKPRVTDSMADSGQGLQVDHGY